jgi:hypothetical protein
MLSTDKFNIIKPLINDDINYESLVKNYLENYFESEINIFHPDLLHQILWSKKISSNNFLTIYYQCFDAHIIQKKQNIRELIKKDKFNLNSLNKIISQLEIKIRRLNLMLLINNEITLYISKILFDPILINYLDSELANTDIKEIELLCSIFKDTTSEYMWLLKLIGSSLKNNLVEFNYNIPKKYCLLYEIKNLTNYIVKINNLYSFIKYQKQYILNPLYELFENIFINIINLCNTTDLHNLISNLYPFVLSTNNNVINNIKGKINLHLSNNISTLDENILEFIDLIVICNKYNIIDSYILLIFENEKFINIILEMIHYNIDDIENIKNIIKLLIKIPDKDILFDKYHKNLIERLLSEQTNLENEKIIIHELKLLFGEKLINKIDKVYNDYIGSNVNLTYYVNTQINSQIVQNITISYANWDIDFNEGYVQLDNLTDKPTLTKQLTDYQYFYICIYENKRQMNWLLQYGEVNVTYNNSNIVLLPIQLLVLELFNENSVLSLNTILFQPFFSKYSNKFKNDIIKSLIIGNILMKDNNNIKLSDSDNIASNFIDIYLNCNQIQSPFIDTEPEIAHSREDIVKSLINHYLKINPKNRNELYTLIQKDIIQFKLTEEIFNKSIDIMLKFDYIIIENETLIKCLY